MSTGCAAELHVHSLVQGSNFEDAENVFRRVREGFHGSGAAPGGSLKIPRREMSRGLGGERKKEQKKKEK